MIFGAHVILYSQDSAADLEFIGELLGHPRAADAGGGWLIYALPPAELAVHPAEENDTHQLYLMCDDIAGFRRAMKVKKVACSAIQEQRWGRLVHVRLPGGGRLGVYQPKHASPHPGPRGRKPARAAGTAKSKARRSAGR